MVKKVIVSLLIILSFFICTQYSAYGQDVETPVTMHKSISLETDKIFDRLVNIRRDFHKYPELSGEEKRTQEVVKQYLLDLGFKVETDIYGYAIVGILEGCKNGKKIAWRADMDALPDDSADDVDFKSLNKGVKHACGHDVHMTIALGIAEVLAQYKDSLQGTVYFIFQPEEEPFTGAKGMVENGLLTKFDIDEIYGLHITPATVGQIFVKSKEVYAYQKGVRIELENTVQEKDARVLASDISNRIVRGGEFDNLTWMNSLLDSEVGLLNPNTLFKDYLVTGGGFYIYPEKGKLYMDIRLYETDSTKLENIIPSIKQIINERNYSDATYSVSQISGNPIVINNPELTDSSVRLLNQIYGSGTVLQSYGQVPFSNDDFAYFQQKIPGVYFFLGGSNFEEGIIAAIHAPFFRVDEECIRVGVRTFSSLLFERLKDE